MNHMPRHLFPQEISEIVQRVNPEVQLCVEEGVATKVASSLQKLSQDLRATSQTLRSRNVAVMKYADEVAIRCHVNILD